MLGVWDTELMRVDMKLQAPQIASEFPGYKTPYKFQ